MGAAQRGEGVGSRAAADLLLAPNTVDNQDVPRRPAARGRSHWQSGAMLCAGNARSEGTWVHVTVSAWRVPERAPGRGNGQPGRAASTCAAQTRAAQASVALASHQPFCRRRTSLIHVHQKSRFFILGIGNAPFASSDATYRADHYGVLRSRVLQRVVAVLQVKV